MTDFLRKLTPEQQSVVKKTINIIKGYHKDNEKLKNDNEFMYFLKSLRNQQYWLIITNGVKIKNDFNSILELIDSELNK